MKWIVIGAVLLLAACGDRNLVVSSAPITVDVAQAADPAGVSMLPVQFRVVNRDNLDAFLSELRTNQGSDNPVFIAISTQDYENLALNLADITRYISQQRSVIVYYRNITSANSQRQP